jgi:hypothetical protein
LAELGFSSGTQTGKPLISGGNRWK